MAEIIMEIKNGNRQMHLYDFVPFDKYSPWVSQWNWDKLPLKDKERHYASAKAKHLRKLGRITKAFMAQ